MKKIIGRVLKRILFKKEDIRSFSGIRITEKRIDERVMLREQGGTRDISNAHCIISHNPFLVAVFREKNSDEKADQASAIEIVKGKEILARMQLVLTNRIEKDVVTILLYSIKDARNFQLSNARQFLFFRLIKDKINLGHRKIYAALYSYPREVILVSHKEEEKIHFFPLDFQLVMPSQGMAILGISNSNKAVEKINGSAKLVICDSGSFSATELYELGKMQKNAPFSEKDILIRGAHTERLHFFVPEGFSYYHEIQIEESLKLGSHIMYMGRIMQSKYAKASTEALYHIHFFQGSKSAYQPE